MKKPILNYIQEETGQGHSTRKNIYKEIEDLIDRPVLSYFTSFTKPVMIDDSDATMICDIVKTMDLSKGLALVINSPGGDGLSAERIINILRSFSGTGEFWAIIPGKAKSAATLISFGASKIMMNRVSELGPVDPQITVQEDGSLKRFCVYNLINSYENLFDAATKTKGNLEPYLQQLSKYDAREIEDLKSSILLSADISVKSLATGMMKGKSEDNIKRDIKIFLDPKHTKTHGRPICIDDAKGVGLNIEEICLESDLCNKVNELYIRLDHFVSTVATKCVENKDNSFVAR